MILSTLNERQAHLDPSEPCLERGGISTHHKGVLAQFLGTDIPSKGIDVCHYCGNGKCSNPRHLYWGTRSENMFDAKRHGTLVNPWELLVEKLGYEGACAQNKINCVKSSGGSGNKGKPKSDLHRKHISDSIKVWHDSRG